MKAVVITPYYFPTIGGLENYARQLNLALSSQQQWEIVIITSQRGHRSVVQAVDGQKIYRLGTAFKLSNTPFNPLWVFKMRAILKLEKPDVIMAHSPVPSLADAAALSKGKTPFVVVYHAATLLRAGSPLFNLLARIYGIFGNFTLARADRIFAVSAFVKQQFPTKWQAKTIVVPNAVWRSEIVQRTQPVTINFVFISSLAKSHAWKGLSSIIEACAEYTARFGNDISLTIIGDGNKRADYEKQVTALGLNHIVTFVGAKVGADKTQILRRATALILYPTTANDAFPTVILEAWAQSVPVIAAAIGPMPSLLNHMSDSIVVPAGQPAALAQAMHTVAQMQPAERAALAATAAARTRRDYTWEMQAQLVTKLVGEIL